jgi:hypothetical protein
LGNSKAIQQAADFIMVVVKTNNDSQLQKINENKKKVIQ